MRKRRLTLATLATLAALAASTLLAAGCHKRDVDAADRVIAMAPSVAMPSDPEAPAAGSAAAVATTSIAVPGLPVARAVANRKLIRTASVTITVDSLVGARERINAAIDQRGGFIAEAQINHQGSSQASATITLRVPSDRADDLVAELGKLGHIESETLGAEDVTDAHADLTARLTNAHAIEARLIELARTAPGNVSQLLEVERELGREREVIEQMNAQLSSMDDRVAYATVHITLYTQPPLVVAAAPPGFVTAASTTLHDSWNALGGLGRRIGLAAVALMPWLPLFLIAGFVIRRAQKRRRHTA